jgi:hypothetical protein
MLSGEESLARRPRTPDPCFVSAFTHTNPMPRQDPDPQKLHDRAAESAKETRQAILTLSSGALAVFFLALTTSKAVEPPLTSLERWVMLLSLSCMAVAVISSLWCAYADAHWSYWWARFVEERDEDLERREVIQHLQDRFHLHKRNSETVLRWAFALGVILAAVYLFSRVYSLKPTLPTHGSQPAGSAVRPARPILQPPPTAPDRGRTSGAQR